MRGAKLKNKKPTEKLESNLKVKTMKPLTGLFSTKHHYKWNDLKKFSGWRSMLSFSEPLYLLAQTIQWKNLTNKAAHLISQAGAAVSKILSLRAVLVSLTEGWTNKRFRVGVIVGMVAIPMWKSHLLFDINERIEDFYYVNYAFYFNTIRAYLCGVFLAGGFFIAAPQKWAFRWWALPVGVFCVTEIIAESYYTKWTDFYETMPVWQMWVIAAASIPALFFSLNYLAYRKYHLKDGTAARLIGVVKTPGISVEQKMDIMERLVQESENFNSRI